MAVVGGVCATYGPCVPARESRSRRPTGIASFPRVLLTNPYQRLLYGALEAEGFRAATGQRFSCAWLLRSRPATSVIHFHWPQTYYHVPGGGIHARVASWIKLLLFTLRLGCARALGYQVIWTAHQVRPHEHAGVIDELGTRVLAHASDVVIVHDETTAGELRNSVPSAAAKLVVIPHGPYTSVYPPGRDRAAVRRDLQIDAEACVFLVFGHVRAYKDIDLVLEAFAQVDRADVVLVVAGAVNDPALARAIERAASHDTRIRPLLGHVADDRVAELFGASDASVLARSDGGTSGALILSLSLGCPVVAADAPLYRELVGDAGWLFRVGDAASLAASLTCVADDPVGRTQAAEAASATEFPGWPEIAARTAAAVRSGPPRPRSIDLLLVCSGGGHLVQMLALREAWNDFSRLWVTLDGSDTRSLLAEESVVYARGPTHRNVRNLIRNCWLAWRLVARHRPAVIMTTGAALAVPFAWIARGYGIRFVYVESITRIEGPSLSCRLVRPAADRLYVQWPELAGRLAGARYVGAVISPR